MIHPCVSFTSRMTESVSKRRSTVPRRSSPAAPSPGEDVSARDRARRRSILVVDDEGGIIDVLIAVLKDAGYAATGASNGQEALAQLRGTLPDLVLLDLEMPVLDGADTLRALSADPRLAGLNVALMSGIPESMVKRRC